MTGWQDERPAHGILVMRNGRLTCTCGTVIELAGKDLAFSQRIQYDLLLDRHATHKARKEKPS